MIWTITCIFITFGLCIAHNGNESTGCQEPLGVENGSIPLAQLTASSEVKERSRAECGRLNTEPNSDCIGAWCSHKTDDNPWIQANLGAIKEVTGVITQANAGGNQLVESYKVSYSVNGIDFDVIRKNDGLEKIFPANSINNTEVTNTFTSVFAQWVRITPVTWYNIFGNKACLRFEILGCPGSHCQDRLGVENGNIELMASSEQNGHLADFGRLNLNNYKGAWCALNNNISNYDKDEWIQANLGAVREVVGVITQGQSLKRKWMKSYEVQHSNGTNFEKIKSENGENRVFQGNWDSNTTVINMFRPVDAQFIRIIPLTWETRICLRFELIGCPLNSKTDEISSMTSGSEMTSSTTSEEHTDEISSMTSGSEMTTSPTSEEPTDEISSMPSGSEMTTSPTSEERTDGISSSMTSGSEMTSSPTSDEHTDEISSMTSGSEMKANICMSPGKGKEIPGKKFSFHYKKSKKCSSKMTSMAIKFKKHK